ncbi:MAG: DUF2442 domain-containing protein [Bacteroidia bacterium]|nr:DUF2442 domain-containing protein [Bacteroidia bacterium]
MKGLRSIPKILKINDRDGYKVSCLFNNGESRIIDLKVFFESRKNFPEKHPAYKLLKDLQEFSQLEILGNTIGWRNTGVYSKDFEGETIFYPYDIDPVVLYENSLPDETRDIRIV